MSDLARSQPAGLGAYAQSIETSPVATLTMTGVMVGALWGTIIGYAGARLMKQDVALLTLAGAAAGALVVGGQGYTQGVELAQWLRQY